MSNASLRLVVIWTGVESTRCTHSGARVPPRFTFTTNLMFFMCLLLLLSFREKTEWENGKHSGNYFSGVTLTALRCWPRHIPSNEDLVET